MAGSYLWKKCDIVQFAENAELREFCDTSEEDKAKPAFFHL